MKVVAAAEVGEGRDPDLAYDDACARIDDVLARLARPAPALPPFDVPAPGGVAVTVPPGNTTRAAFEANVRRIQEYILAGDAFQVVYSQRFGVPGSDVDPFDVYRALRVTNPSPYMFHLEFPEAIVTGASPEVLVRMDHGEIELRPIAGTHRRGATPEEDAALEAALTSDPKERAEHVMLIDLGRNDVGRVSLPGTVRVTEQMIVERYSHVMHIVSNIRGKLSPGLGPADVIRAAFPAGTLSGAPKIRAMEIIEEMEPSRRGIYGGAVGYISYSGNVDLAIGIRTLVAKGESIYVQAGAGIVAGSVPSAEFEESVNKARAVLAAVELARRSRARAGIAMLLVIDNYDSFTYNLVQYLGELGQDVRVVRNDEIARRRHRRAGAEPHRHLARAVHAQRGRHQPGGDRALRRAHAHPGRVPGPSVDRPGVRRQRRPRARGDARQDVADRARRARRVHRPAEPLSGDALSLAGRRPGQLARLPRDLGDRRRRRAGRPRRGQLRPVGACRRGDGQGEIPRAPPRPPVRRHGRPPSPTAR